MIKKLALTLTLLILSQSPCLALSRKTFAKLGAAPFIGIGMGIAATYYCVCKVGEWNDKSHFGSAISLVGNVGMAKVGLTRLHN